MAASGESFFQPMALFITLSSNKRVLPFWVYPPGPPKRFTNSGIMNAQNTNVKWFRKTTTPLIAAHRGLRELHPENTGVAFDAALQKGISIFECDVQLSGDGQGVLFHDRTLRRMGISGSHLWKYTSDEIARMDFGQWFNHSFKHTPPLFFDEYLKKYGPKALHLIELKAPGRTSMQQRNEQLVQHVISQLKAHSLQERSCILSFSTDVLLQVKKLSRKIPVILNVQRPWFRSLPEQVDGFCCNIRFLSRSFALAVRKKRKALFTYTCNSPGQWKKALETGVDIIISDAPHRARQFVDSQAPASHGPRHHR